jgi:hypothetical protein
MRTFRLIRGWVCYRLVLLLPICLNSSVYCWVLGWGGWYAHGGDGVQEVDRG